MILLSILSILALVPAISCSSAFARKPNPESVNWTSCPEFVNNTKLDINKLLNIDWKIFFFWNPEYEASYIITFTKPTSTLVDRFRVELKDLKPPANWSNAELFLETDVGFSALAIKTLTPGIFRVVPTTAFEYEIPTAFLLFGFKLVEPGYLGISNCLFRIAYALAPVDKLPYHADLEKAASTLKFYCPYNRTHIARPQYPTTGIPFAKNHTYEDEHELEEDHQDIDKMDFF